MVHTVTKRDLRGTASGVLFMAFFGTLWAYTGIMGLQGWGSPWLLTVALAIGFLLVLSGFSLIHASKKFPDGVSSPEWNNSRKMRKWFNIIFAGEGIAIGIAIAVCNAVGHTENIPIVIAIIVGLHFLPLARLFRVKIYYYTGILLCVVPVVTWLFIPETLMVSGHELNTYMSVVGLASALILWVTSLAIWMTGKRLMGLVPDQLTDDLTR
ncbi:DUF7010 family protein [Rossellomorea vietnamensis]|uniref:Uncharacterized protein n=1 Tax=Rossellomorea vietnamensis TaxID=218284 RepID=A0A0P6WHM1_9BACI|nr:hypothetical protein [Rossellomorea vietnamensis]KPL60925.1 hypothetical protein AM506_04125 [Rossellomorea vietnamensis]